MADPVGALRVEMSADHAQLASDMGKAHGVVRTFGARTKVAMDQVRRSFASAFDVSNILKSGIAGLAAGLSLRELYRYAEAWTKITNQLKLVADDVPATRAALVRLATDTGSSLEGTVALYARMTRATRELGTSEAQRMQAVKTINQLMALSGATAQESAAALLQLSQAFASNRLAGEEFRSIAEQAPMLLDAIARSLNVTSGELRKMAMEGKITGQVMLDALAQAAAETEQQFRSMDLTMGRALENLKTRTMELVGTTDQSSRATMTLAQLVNGLANYGIPGLGTAVETALAPLAAFVELLEEAAYYTGQASRPPKATGIWKDYWQGPKAPSAAEIQKAADDLARVTAAWEGLDAIRQRALAGLDSDAGQLAALLARQNKELAEANELALTAEQRELYLMRLRAYHAAELKAFKAKQAEQDDHDAERAAKRTADAIADLQRELALLGDISVASKIRWQIEHEGLAKGDPLRQAELKQLAERLDLERLLIGIQKDRAAQSQAAEGRAGQIIADNLSDADRLRAQLEELEVLHKRLPTSLLVGGGLGDEALLSDKQYEQARQRLQMMLDATIAAERLAARQKALNAGVADGTVTHEQYRAAIAAAQAAMEGAAAAIIERWELVDRTFEEWSQRATDALVRFAMTGKLAFGDFARSVIADLLRIQIQAEMTSLFRSLEFSGAGSFVGGLFSGGAFRRGTPLAPMVPGSEVAAKPVASMAAVAANGMSELRSASKLASRGLELDGQAAAPAGAAPVNLRVVNLSDRDQVPGWVSTSPGEKAILNVIGRNATQLKTILRT